MDPGWRISTGPPPLAALAAAAVSAAAAEDEAACCCCWKAKGALLYHPGLRTLSAALTSTGPPAAAAAAAEDEATSCCCWKAEGAVAAAVAAEKEPVLLMPVGCADEVWGCVVGRGRERSSCIPSFPFPQTTACPHAIELIEPQPPLPSPPLPPLPRLLSRQPVCMPMTCLLRCLPPSPPSPNSPHLPRFLGSPSACP